MSADPSAPAVRVRELTKRYGDRLALDGVELTVAPGEIRGLLGPNGAGKTTLLRTLFGFVHADGGSVELLGHLLTPAPRRPIPGVAGFVEEPAFYPYLSGRANLELLAVLDNGDGDDDLDAALARVGLLPRADDRVGGYSTGMRQRLGIAAALIRRPRLLLLDEPTSGLDPAGIAAVAKLLTELARDGVSVIISSHLIGELEDLCHSYTVMRTGRVVWDGDARRLATDAPAATYALTTSDDARALALAGKAAHRAATGITLAARGPELDRYVLELARHGIAVRRLELLVSPLKALFFALAGEG